MRRTKIIATIGPKTESVEMIRKLADTGVNIVRINLSHGTPEWINQVMGRLKEVQKGRTFPLGILIDTQGPEIRTTSSKEVGLEEGDLFKIAVSSACDIEEGEKHTFINHAELTKQVKRGDIILIDNGLVAVEILRVSPYHLTCKVLNKGNIGTKKSVNIPGVRTNLPAITQKDISDLTLCAKFGFDFLAQSFVRKKEDVAEMRTLLKHIGSKALLIAKIEDQQGVDNMDAIIEAADGIMVARGDLGVEIPIENIPIVQKQIVQKCIKVGKPVIIATQLLESMISNPRPTRAEVTDVANAVFEKADAMMLSGETTKGEYPLDCVKMMHRIAKNVQTRLVFDSWITALKTKDVRESIALGACINAENLDAKAIIVFTETGRLLGLVAKRRPNVDIFAFTFDESVRKRLMLFWNTFPFLVTFNESMEALVSEATNLLKNQKLLVPGDRVIIISDLNPKKDVEILEIRRIG